MCHYFIILYLFFWMPNISAEQNPLRRNIRLVTGTSKEIILPIHGGLRISRRGLVDLQHLAGETYMITGLKPGIVMIKDSEEDAYGPSYRLVVEVIKKPRKTSKNVRASSSFYRIHFWIEDNSSDKNTGVNISKLSRIAILRTTKSRVQNLKIWDDALPNEDKKTRFLSKIDLPIQSNTSFEIRDGGEQQSTYGSRHHGSTHTSWKQMGLSIKGKLAGSHKGNPVLQIEVTYKYAESSSSVSSKKIKSRVPLAVGSNQRIGNLDLYANRKERGTLTGLRKVPIISPLLTRWGKSQKKGLFTLWARLENL